jgi:general stress protein 26
MENVIMTEKQGQRFEEVIEKFDNAMLITQSSDGGLHARPMAIAKHQHSGALYFATNTHSIKIGELETHPEVAVTMQNKNQYLTLAGRAEEVRDQSLIESFFSPMWKLWFPKGKDDPDLVLIKVEPSGGEYWDMSKTLDKAKFIFEAGKAYIEGEEIDEDKLSGHGKVGF